MCRPVRPARSPGNVLDRFVEQGTEEPTVDAVAAGQNHALVVDEHV